MAFVPKLPADRRGPNDYVWDADCGKRMPRTGPRGSEATDKAALSALFEASGGTAWTHTKGWDINPERVTLDGPARYRALGVERKYTKDYATTPRVVSVDCNGLGLAGLLTACGPAIGQLSEVERLQLARSKLAGAVCPQLEWAYTRNLSLLDLSDNRLTGTLPPTLLTLTRLEFLNVSGNALGGPLPEDLGNLVRIRQLSLGGNLWTGTLPFNPGLRAMPDLRLLDCSGAKLDGSLPEDGTLGRLTNLVCLNLSHNELCGRLPESLANLRNLRRLRINDNQLDGPIPKKLFENLTKLTVLDVANNAFVGAPLDGVSHLSALRILSAGGNLFSGQVPAAALVHGSKYIREVKLRPLRLTVMPEDLELLRENFPDALLETDAEVDYFAGEEQPPASATTTGRRREAGAGADDHETTDAVVWESAYDGDGYEYFYNTLTGDSQYERPLQGLGEHPPSEWETHNDQESGAEYYYNPTTGLTTWDVGDTAAAVEDY